MDDIETKFASKVTVWKDNADDPEYSEPIVIDVVDSGEEDNIVEIYFHIKDKGYYLRFNRKRFDEAVKAAEQ